MNYLAGYLFLGLWTWGVLAIADYAQIRHFNSLRLTLSVFFTSILWPLFLLGIFISQSYKVDDLENK